MSLNTMLKTFAGAQNWAKRPPFTADKRLRMMLISVISAPQARSCFVMSASSSPGSSGFSKSADPPPDNRKITVSSFFRPPARSKAARVPAKE